MSRLLCLLMITAMPAFADTPRVVADIAPIGSIVANIMKGVGEPDILVPNGASPHDYALRPSEARNLAEADVVIWVGPALTKFLEKPIFALAGDAAHVTLMDGPFEFLPVRENDGDHEGHNDTDADHDAHNHEDHAESTHDEETHDDHENHDDHDGDEKNDDHHDHGSIDPHLWLDPSNAALIAGLVADTLIAKDPENKALYLQNYKDFLAGIELLSADLTAQLAPFEDTPFLVLHDAFQYFEARFHLSSSVAVMKTDADAPGPARIAGLRDQMANAPVMCAFAEPQMNAALIDTVVEGHSVQMATLNPIGDASLPLADQYLAMLRTMADSMAACMSNK